MKALPIALLLAGCATSAAGPTSGERALQAEFDAREPGEAARCLPASTNAISSIRIIAPDTVVYRVGGTLWLTRTSCGGLDPTDSLLVEPFAGELCQGDGVRRLSSGARIAGPRCRFGRFTPYRPRSNAPSAR